MPTLRLLVLTVLFAPPALAQQPAAEPGGLAAVAAMEKVVVDAIARNEASVVAIGIFSRERLVNQDRPELDAVPDAFGTGVVIDPRGLVLTNLHVLREEAKIFVRLGGQPFWCLTEIKGGDAQSDLAVLQISDPPADRIAKLVRPIVFGDGGRLKRGQFVISLGNPYAIARDGQASAAWGIVSNLGRKAPPTGDEQRRESRPTMHHFGTLIQTDAKLNMGTSGGPLLNLQGEMVGLTTAMAALTGHEKSAGYAVAVDETFRRIVRELAEGREVEYGFLGVAPRDMEQRLLAQGARGVVIRTVVEGTPAFEVLRSMDVVTHVAGEPVTTSTELMLAIGKRGAGERVRLDLVRGGRRMDVLATLTKNHVPGRKIVTNPRPAWRGLRVEYPSALRSLSETDPIPTGCVIVLEVQADSPAATAGLRKGMRISQVEGQPVDTPDKFLAAAAPLKRNVRLLAREPGSPPQEISVTP